jgi:adenosylmethionine---8-amino-7-oxononanoate aminotransferase
MKTLTERDAHSVWHPYSQHGLGNAPLPVVRAQGAYLELANGAEILDGISSWWVNIHGHGHPALVEAVSRQLAELDHVLFAGFTHAPAVELAEVLLKGAHESGLENLTRVFYSDNGSTAVEVALKMAFQFHRNRGVTGRNRFLALKGSYHGDTMGAMGASDPSGFHAVFQPLLPKVDFVRPDHLEDLRELLARHPAEHAAFIFEPLIQGAGGMLTYSAAYLEEAAKLCREHGILLIADEVFTGFFRTGTRYAIEQTRVQPDLLCVSKGITGGVLPLAATLTSNEVFEAFRSDRMRDAFLHGHSYTANPVACAAALASARLLDSAPTREAIARITRETEKHIAGLALLPGVRSARCLGTIGAIELAHAPDYYQAGWSADVMHRAIERGVLLRPLGPVLYAVPPYCTSSSELARIYQTMKELIQCP